MSELQHAKLTAKNGNHMLFRGAEMRGDLRGMICEWHLIQKFTNVNSTHAEIVYTFPLPYQAVLLNIEVTLGEKKLTGLVIEKKQAENRYEETLSNGDTAIMLEQHADDSFGLSLGNIDPNEDCVICIHFAQPLTPTENSLRLMVPTVIAPRYQSSLTRKLSQSSSPFQIESSIQAEYAFSLQLLIHLEHARARIASPTHPMTIKHTGSCMEVSLSSKATLDRDFILVLDELVQDTSAYIGIDKVNPEHYAMMATFSPRLANSKPKPITLNLLVDCSGSMAGASIEAAKNALHSMIRSLTNEDRYCLSRFGSHVEHRSRGLWRPTEISKLSAHRWIDSLDANLGGTEMAIAIESSFNLVGTSACDLMLITDGQISDIDDVLSKATSSKHRVFVVGIGSAPAESHLRRLAEATGGACEFVSPGENVEAATLRMFARLRSSQLKNLALQWSDGCVPIWTSNLDRPCFEGDMFSVFALSDVQPRGTIQLLGIADNELELHTVGSATVNTEILLDETVSRLAAHSLIQEKDRQKANPSETTAIAIDYQLVTSKTNFILTHERVAEEKNTDMPVIFNIQQMTPAYQAGLGRIQSRSQDQFKVLGSKPAVFRRSATAMPPVQSNNDLDQFDIPAFLRKSPVPLQNMSRNDQLNALIDKSNSNIWRYIDGEKALTPLGAANWLELNPTDSWPSTWSELTSIGISQDIVLWLQMDIFQQFTNDCSEKNIVHSFLYALLNKNLCRSIELERGNLLGLLDLFNRTKKNDPVTSDSIQSLDINTKVVGLIDAKFSEMSVIEWPDLFCEA